MIRALLALVMLAASVAASFAYSVTLAWDPNSETDLAGYNMYVGTGSGQYTQVIPLGLVTTNTVTNLVKGVTYYFVVTAFNTSGLESDPSNEVNWRTPILDILGGISPANATNRIGSSLTLALTNIVHEPSARFQWLLDGAIIAGATNKSLALTNLQYAQAGTYTLRISDTNALLPVIERTAVLHIKPAAPRQFRVTTTLQLSGYPQGPWRDGSQLVSLIEEEDIDTMAFFRAVLNIQLVP